MQKGNMKEKIALLIVCVLLVVVDVLLINGCGKKQPETIPETKAMPAPTIQSTPTIDKLKSVETKAENHTSPSPSTVIKSKTKQVKSFEVMPPVLFSFDSSSLIQDSLQLMNQIISPRLDGASQIKIVGHACRLGSDAYNLALGLRRAQTIKNWLIDYGVSSDRIEIETRGESEPTALGLVFDRRVIVTIRYE